MPEPLPQHEPRRKWYSAVKTIRPLESKYSVLNRPLHRLQSDEGPALGAAVTVLAALETRLSREKGDTTPFTVAETRWRRW